MKTTSMKTTLSALAAVVVLAGAASVAQAKCPYSAAEVETKMEDPSTWVPLAARLPKVCPKEHINIVRAIKERLEAAFPNPNKRSSIVVEKILRAQGYLEEHHGQESHLASPKGSEG